jgi:peptidoglycan hydrolase-like protein with peptidoglycan-binding domain
MSYILKYNKWRELTEAVLSIDAPAAAGTRFAEILKSNYQVKEQPKGSNKGPEVSAYLQTAGVSPGNPWCMAFVYSMFNNLSSALGTPNPLPKTAGVMYHWNKADTSLKITVDEARKNPGLVKPGQIFIMSRPGQGKGHTGIVVSVDIANKSFKAIEGNTNDQLSGEGDRVGINKRNLSASSLIGFIDYFKGKRDEKFENIISQTLTNQKTDFSADEKDDAATSTAISNQSDYSSQNLLKIGATGEEVTKVQAKLGVTQSGNYDAATAQAVRTFQTNNKDASGTPLRVDGIVGPKTREALFGTTATLTTPKPSAPVVNSQSSDTVILMGGLDYRPGDYKIDSQVDLLSKGLTKNQKVLGYRYNDLNSVLTAISQNPMAKVILFSAGGSYASKIASAMQNKNNLYIVEPYGASANTKNSVQAAVTSGVPSANVIAGPSSGRGSAIVSGATSTPSGKGHWDALQYAGTLIS